MKKWTFAPLAALLTLTLAAAPRLALAGPTIAHWQTTTGTPVFFIESHAVPILDIQIDFAAGGAQAAADKAGLAGLTRGLLDSGAGTLDEEQIAERLVDSGAQLGGGADLDRASVSLRTLSSARERDAALDLLTLVIQQPSFPAAVLEREKARTIAGIEEADTRPASLVSKRFSRELYGDHPYGQIPTAQSVAQITRDDLLAFYRAHYSAQRAIVSIVGDVDRQQAEILAERLTQGLPQTSDSATIPPVPATQAKTVRIAHPAQQAHIRLGMPAVQRGDPDHIALLVGNYILGGGSFASRLMKEVREKRGLAYSVYSSFDPLRQAGPFFIGLQTRRDQTREALEVVRQVLAEFLQRGPSRAELRAAQQNLAGGFPLRIDSNAKLLGYLSMIGFYGLPLSYLDNFQKDVEAVTLEQIRAAFARHVQPEHFVTVIVGGE